MALSVLVALVLTPALCATLLKPASAEHHEKKGFFGWFNARFDQSVNHYTNSVSGILRGTGRYLVIYLLIVVGMAVLFMRLPHPFCPMKTRGLPDHDPAAFRRHPGAHAESAGYRDRLLSA
jgi:multidrug efflux pump